MALKTNADGRTRSSVQIFIVAGLCCFFYILGAWQRSGFGKGDSIALEITKNGADCNIIPSLSFESHHSGEAGKIDESESKPKVFKPCHPRYTDYTPCQDQKRAMTFPRDDMNYRERHCPPEEEKLHCLIPAPKGYVTPFPWPKSRDYVPYANAPYKSLTVEKAVQNWIHEMPQRIVVSWTTMISAYSNAKLNHKALESLVLMLREDVMPNSFTYSSVLRACDGLWYLKQLHCSIIRVGLESDVFVRSALIDVYSKLGELHNALGVFNEMVTGDLVVWNSIIGAFAQNSDGDEALNLFKRMKGAGFSAEEATLTSVLRACTVLALLELGRQVHVHAVKYGQDLILNNALLDMYCKCGSLEDANSVFTRMVEKDVISWSTMIAGLAQNGFSQEALKLFEQMKISGIKPNYITILGVLFACSHAGLLEDGWYYFQNMKQLFGIDPGREHYGCVIDLLGRAGKVDEAARLIQEMECEPDAVTWRTLLGACRVHRNVDLAAYAAKQVLKMDPDDAGTYILLSNIYANSQRWEDAAEVRKSMRARGVNKEPGCSWIEVNKQIHAFIMGDDSHPQIDEINRQLSLLVDRLMGMGYVPDTNFVLQDLEGEQREVSLLSHSEKLAIVFGIMSLSKGRTVRIRKNLRICGDCHIFAKLVAKMEERVIVIRDPIRYHHFQDGVCSCGDYW